MVYFFSQIESEGVVKLKIKVSADSTCDLSPELLRSYGIEMTPLYIVSGGRSYRDGLDICPDDIYRHVADGGEICSTAAVSVADYQEFFTDALRHNDAVIHMHISSEMSACYQNACIASSEMQGVYPIDSRNLSTGIGHLVLDAADMAREGMDAAEIAAELDRRKQKLDVSFIVDTLAYLRKGGRCSALAAMGANLLHLKPCIEVKNGVMGVGKKYRGSLEKCLMQYIRERLEGRDDIDTRRIFITESGGYDDEAIERVRQEILKYQPFEEILHTRAGCTVSSHCGPGTLGILYYHK